ncbi:MAG: nicotinate-nucleotide adenylyltransferase [Gemmatimonadota bacterium]
MTRGLLGGTFDPPHIGHLIAAREALERLGLDRVAFLPAAVPPHKTGSPISPAAHRLAMLRAAVAGEARFEIEEAELDRTGPSYTVDTLRALRTAAPGTDLVLLLGADQHAELSTWREPAAVRELARLVVIVRAGEVPDGAVERLDMPRIDISSTLVRERVARGLSVRWLVPGAVEQYIEDQGLYRTGRRAAG